MTKNDVLEILSSEKEFVSGEYISRKLGVSRVAVNKAVTSLKRDGYVIESSTYRGYMLKQRPDCLSVTELKRNLDTECIGKDILCFDSIDSTNTYVKNNYEKLNDGTVVIAEKQTDGRGRLGRSFVSLPGVGIYMSVLLKPEKLDKVSFLTAITGVCVCNAIEKVTAARPKIKWTNDIIMQNKKVCGILTEMGVEGETGKIQYVVIGMGINVNQTEEDFPKELRNIAGSIREACGKKIGRVELCRSVIEEMDVVLSDIDGHYSKCLDLYRKDCMNIGRRILVMKTQEGTEAEAVAVEEDFSLRVRYPDGKEESIKSGEVSIRGMMGYA